MASLHKYGFYVFAAVMLLLIPALPLPAFWITQLNMIGLYSIAALGLVVGTAPLR